MSNNFEIIKMEAETIFKKKSMLLAYLFLLFLGGLGVHRFYLNENKGGIAYLILFFLIMFSGIPYLQFILSIAILADVYFVYALTEKYNKDVEEKIMTYVKKKMESEGEMPQA